MFGKRAEGGGQELEKGKGERSLVVALIISTFGVEERIGNKGGSGEKKKSIGNLNWEMVTTRKITCDRAKGA